MFNGEKDMWDQYCDEKKEAIQYILGRDKNIKKIGEIGVYAGYGAHAIMKTAKAEQYYGWDILPRDSKELSHADSLLRRKAPWKRTIYHSRDTQESEGLEETNLDLFHIDGDHHPVACYHDMQLAYKALRNNGWMLIDDYGSNLVKHGVDCWAQIHKHDIMHQHYIPGTTGNYIIQIGAKHGIQS